jgi:hypothetical protein
MKAMQGWPWKALPSVPARAVQSSPVAGTAKAALAIAAIRQQMAKHPLEVLDRGNLRTELLEFVERASERAAAIAAAFTLFTSKYFSETSSNPEARTRP